MDMPKEVLVIGADTATMKVADALKTFNISEQQLANCINKGTAVKDSQNNDVYFDIPLD